MTQLRADPARHFFLPPFRALKYVRTLYLWSVLLPTLTCMRLGLINLLPSFSALLQEPPIVVLSSLCAARLGPPGSFYADEEDAAKVVVPAKPGSGWEGTSFEHRGIDKAIEWWAN